MSGPGGERGDVEPADALRVLAGQLQAEQTVISAHIVVPPASPALGMLAAAGPRASRARGEYALVVESVREGYLLHYDQPRLLAGHDPDLALLAGDYLYARGIERLASLGDAEAVRELSELISLAAECHAEDRAELAAPLWLATAVAVGCGGSSEHESAKADARRLGPGAAARLRGAARSGAREAGLVGDLDRATEAIDSDAARAEASG